MKKLFRRFGTLKSAIKIGSVSCIIYILIAEFLLSSYPFPDQKTFRLVINLILKLSYSFSAATLFYFINQHVPKENRKIKTLKYTANKVGAIVDEVSQLLEVLVPNHKAKKNIDSEITMACKAIRVLDQVKSPNESKEPFVNWHNYIDFKTKRISKLIDEIIILEDLLNEDVLHILLNIQTTLSFRSRIFDRISPEQKNLNDYRMLIIDLFHDTNKALDLFLGKTKIYNDEFFQMYGKDASLKYRSYFRDENYQGDQNS